MTEKKKPSIFLSHSWDDKFFARKLAEKLRENGLIVWIDEAEIKVGDLLLPKIGDAISKTDFVAVVLSHNSVASKWVQKELSMAMAEEVGGRDLKVLPILLEKCDIPIFLRDKMIADFTDPLRFDHALSTILEAVNPPEQKSAPNAEPEDLEPPDDQSGFEEPPEQEEFEPPEEQPAAEELEPPDDQKPDEFERPEEQPAIEEPPETKQLDLPKRNAPETNLPEMGKALEGERKTPAFINADLELFEDIVLINVATDKIFRPNPESALYNVPFELSTRPPLEWVQIFDEERRFPRHSSWRRAWIDDRYVIVRCALPEIKEHHFDDLKEDIFNSNKKYREYLRENIANEQIQNIRKVKEQREIKKAFEGLDFS